MTTNDLHALLKAQSFQNLGTSRLNFSAYDPPVWWDESLIGTNAVHYACETTPRLGRDFSAKTMLMNPDTGEAMLMLSIVYYE